MAAVQPFWELQHSPSTIALVSASSDACTTYGDLQSQVDAVVSQLPQRGRKSLGVILARNDVASVVAYLASLQSRNTCILLDASLSTQLLQRLIHTYQPDWILGAASVDLADYDVEPNGSLAVRRKPTDLDIHPEAALLLSTSGSTGSPKMVRLSYANLQANAESITEYLGISAEERPITSLPMAYSYGLSVLNSHLLAGASIVLNEYGVLQREFWAALDAHRGTSIAGVPYTYQMFLRTGLLGSRPSSLRTLTQAGGRLDESSIEQLLTLSETRGWRFFVMYGQTEATARMSYVPFERLREKLGSVGVAIPRGALNVDPNTGELVYRGANVMLGYAECREDLAKGDECMGVLRTGDLARQDEDGYFYVTGRMRRFLKLFGKRFNLDEMEKTLVSRCHCTIACHGQDDQLRVAVGGGSIDPVSEALKDLYGLPASMVRVYAVSELPLTLNGKIDYESLKSKEAAVGVH